MLGAAAESGSGGPAYFGVRVTVARTGARQPLAILQATHDQEGRELAQAVDLRAAREQELRGREDHEAHLSMYPDQRYPGYRWGMAIDVDACVGCQACVVACQAENNVAVVGRAQAANGRGLPSIRTERWGEGEPAHAGVTVRQLGGMEKCTMCVQRIIGGKDHARDDKRTVKDGDILTACQQTCPTRAITFGNLKDEQSAVTKLARSPRAYHVLEEVGTRPSVSYLRKVVREHASR